jgi:hypothetical protein
MIGSIRKHSKWLWWFIAGATIISFVFFMGTPGRGGHSGGAMDFGSIYGRPVTEMDYDQARNDFDLFWLFNYGTWPEKDTSLNQTEIDKQIYANILFLRKARLLGVAVSDQTVVSQASQMLTTPNVNRAIGNRSGKAVTMDEFVKEVLEPHHLNAADYQHFVITQMTVEQLELSMGLSGAIISPQEAESLYNHEYQEASTEAVFFSASNYVDKVTVAPGAAGEFFTNYMAYYREPDRVQINYIWLNITNYLTQSKDEWAKTNFTQIIDSLYLKTDPSQFGDAKTPEAAKAKIREYLIRERANADAAKVARDFVDALFGVNPVKLENFAVVAKQKGLDAHLTAAFSQQNAESVLPEVPDLAKTAFALNADSPFSDAIAGGDGIYMIGLAAQLPSAMPSFGEIRAQVTRDYELQKAAELAREAGTNFCIAAPVQMALGKSFAQAAEAHGFSVVTPAVFSLESQEIPEIGDHVEPNAYKQAAFTTPGHASQLIPTRDGGFAVYVKFILPPAADVKAEQLPRFTAQLRRSRESEAFGIWANEEASREFVNVPALQKAPTAAKAP